MAILVVGSVAFDSIETPHGKVDRMLGGAATYIALAASYFTPVKIVAVVGDDFAPEDYDLLGGRGIDLGGDGHVGRVHERLEELDMPVNSHGAMYIAKKIASRQGRRESAEAQVSFETAARRSLIHLHTANRTELKAASIVGRQLGQLRAWS